MTRAFFLLVVVGLMGTVAVAQPQPPAKPLIEQIEDAWKARAEKVKTAEFVLEVEKYYPKGAISEEHGKTDAVIPDGDRRVKYVGRYLLRDDQIRLEEEGVRWNGGEFVDTREVFLHERESELSYESVKSQVGTGVIGNHPSEYFHTRREPFLPLTMCYRGAGPGPWVPFSLADFAPSGRGVINGVDCQAVIRTSTRGATRTLWLDPASGWVVIRDSRRSSNGDLTETDIRYATVAAGQPAVITGWRGRTLRAGKRPSYTWEVTAKRADFAPRVGDDDFRFAFPPGATVVRDGVTTREILQTTATGELSPHPLSHTTQQFAREKVSRRVYGLIASGLCLFVLFAFITLIRRRGRWHLPTV